MYYVMSDIHGRYDKYSEMLEKINFSDDDTLYILGDVIDVGEQPVKILQDMMNRPNVYPVMGNHEYMAIHILSCLSVEITDKNYSSTLDAELMELLLDWQTNGGQSTIEAFCKLSPEERSDILDYLSDFEHYAVEEVSGKVFILVHSGLGNFQKGRKLSEYTIEELAFIRSDPDTRYFDDDDVFIVSGHTPTLAITGKPKIYQNANNIFIDCGAAYSDGRLACLRLDDMQEFYI